MKYLMIAVALVAMTQTQNVFAEAEGEATMPPCYFNSNPRCWQSNFLPGEDSGRAPQQPKANVLHKTPTEARAYCEGYYSASYSWTHSGWVFTGYVCNEVINGAGG